MDGRTVLRKELMHGITPGMCRFKQDFVNFLRDSGVPAARILHVYPEQDRLVEIQEYIAPGNASCTLDDLLCLLGRFHRAAEQYPGGWVGKVVLPDKVEIEGARLEQVLVGFWQKFVQYPRADFDRSATPSARRIPLLQAHSQIVQDFLAQAGDFCLIHNDLTPFNLVRGRHLTLIDFDLTVPSYPCVDVADVLFNREIEVEDYLPRMQDSRLLDHTVRVYNAARGREALTPAVLRLMAALKLYAYILYIYAKTRPVTPALYDYLMQVYRTACPTLDTPVLL